MPDFILCCDSLKPSPSRYCRNCGLGEILLRYNGGGLALANVREEGLEQRSRSFLFFQRNSPAFRDFNIYLFRRNTYSVHINLLKIIIQLFNNSNSKKHISADIIKN